MNSDIRLQVTWYSNAKRWELQDQLGAEGCLAFIDLLIYTAMNKPKGHLTKMNDLQVERAAQWTGEPGKLIEVLTQLGFLEQKLGYHVIHEWNIHNTYASKAPERSAKARRAAIASHSDSAKRKPKQSKEPKRAVLKFATSSAPSPSPLPKPSPKDKISGGSAPGQNPVALWVDLHKEILGQKFIVVPTHANHINLAFKALKKDLPELEKRIRNCFNDKWYRDNQPGPDYFYRNINKFENPTRSSNVPDIQ